MFFSKESQVVNCYW